MDLLLRRRAMMGEDIGGSLVPVDNVGIACWANGERRYFTALDWKDKNKPFVLGIYVNTVNTHIILNTQRITGNWSDPGLCPNVFTTTSSDTAKTDYDGIHNTQYVWGAYQDGIISGIALFEGIKSLAFADGSEGYLPAMGELWDIFQQYDTITSLLSLLGVEWRTLNLYSSTQRDSNTVWTAYQNDQIRALNKAGGYGAIAVIPLYNSN